MRSARRVRRTRHGDFEVRLPEDERQLLLTLVGYFAGRLGDVTTKSSAHPSLIAVGLGTIGFGLGSAVLHFMLGSTISAGEFFVGVLLPSLALNLLLAYPLYGLCRRIFQPEPRERHEVSPAV